MSDDIRPGDLVVCVDDSPPRRPYFVKRGWHSFPIKRGTILRVRDIALSECGKPGLLFVGHVAGHYERTGIEMVYHPSRFRKLNDGEDDAELIERIKQCKPIRQPEPVL